MTAVERWGAAYLTLGLSMRMSELGKSDLAEIDRDDARDWFVPAQRTPTP
ncbi:hypothetical protein ACIBK9_47470 [Nonomuraea sp. NPDC050227]